MVFCKIMHFFQENIRIFALCSNFTYFMTQIFLKKSVQDFYLIPQGEQLSNQHTFSELKKVGENSRDSRDERRRRTTGCFIKKFYFYLLLQGVSSKRFFCSCRETRCKVVFGRRFAAGALGLFVAHKDFQWIVLGQFYVLLCHHIDFIDQSQAYYCCSSILN